ncbi:hypothetical protein N0V84_006476 [Fusarium piperis]|uniref:DUF7580 domain-containing protein n=1 Tax=Fusarium piperis TaxID=1435070 RepID=A0A9W9BN80_9HYPO|nr:hypothetical protein N0V84_006476 [Fusarium piperis]
MSGFEIAGIILGSIPLVIATLENYGKGLSALQRWRKYKRELQSLIRNLETERIKLQNVCEKLLIGLVPDSRIEALINNPMGNLWKEEETLYKIRFRLGKGFDVFEVTMRDLRTTIDEMARRIGSQNEGVMSGLRRAAFTLHRSQYADLLSEIRDSISNLENLTDRSMELEPARKGRSRGKLFVLIRSMSESLYRALGSSLNCACGHDVGLGLESRTDEVFPADEQDRILNFTTFKIAVSYTEGLQVTKLWEEISVKPSTTTAQAVFSPGLPISPPPPSRQRDKKSVRFSNSMRGSSSATLLVHSQSSPESMNFHMSTTFSTPGIGSPVSGYLSLCERIKSSGKRAEVSSYGTIRDDTSVGGKEYSLSPARFLNYQDTCCQSVISLREILEQKNNSFHLPYRDRLQLAVVVSSSILQLLGNPWLPDTLSSYDIFFLKTRDYPMYSRPFLMRSNRAGKGNTTSPPFCNPALWSLGVLLIELILGKTLDSLRTPEEESSLPVDYFTAHRLLDEVRMASSNYGTAVTRCLGGELHNNRFCPGSEDFCQEVYSGVVSLLERDLENS